MKKVFFVTTIVALFNSFLGVSQQVLTPITISQNTVINSIPSGISALQAEQKLITQNSFFNPSGTQVTGSFSSTARWNSMGNLPAGSQTINGFRTQTDGRGLAWGHSVPNVGLLSNSFVEWIGNDYTASSTLPSVGNLDFNYGIGFGSPGSPGKRTTLFSLQPLNPTFTTGIKGFAYAADSCLIGQLKSGNVGGFTTNDTWSATGLVNTPSFETYGTRQQYKGYTFNSGILNNGVPEELAAVVDFGYNSTLVQKISSLKFRTFTDPNNPNSISNIMQMDSKGKNIYVSRREVNAILPSLGTGSSNFGVFDGPNANASNTASTFINRAGIYATSDGKFDDGTTIGNYGAIVGDVSLAVGTLKVAVLGVTNPNYTGGASNSNTSTFAGYFIGRLGYTGSLISVSDRKYKKSINTETTIMDKVMQLAPKNYYFDVEKNKNMALSNTLQHGFISEEVEKIFPELVEEAYGPSTSTDAKTNGKPESYKGLNYIGFIPVLTKAIQELNEKVTVLEKQLADAKSATYVATKTVTPQEQQLLANKTYMLAQNVPNPFSQSTVIKYSLPNSTDKAVLVILNLNGTLIQQFALSAAKGSSQVTVNAGTLAAGKYIYSLLINGEEVITKTMVVL